MDLDTLKMIFALMAVAGGVACVVALSYTNSFTAWRSKLGVCAIVGLILLGAGLGGLIILTKHQLSNTPASYSLYVGRPQARLVYAYSWGIKPNGHVGYGFHLVLR